MLDLRRGRWSGGPSECAAMIGTPELSFDIILINGYLPSALFPWEMREGWLCFEVSRAALRIREGLATHGALW